MMALNCDDGGDVFQVVVVIVVVQFGTTRATMTVTFFSFDVAGPLADVPLLRGTDDRARGQRPHQPEPAHVRPGVDMPHE